MKNKELALKKIEQVNNAITNAKTSAYRMSNDLSERFDKVAALMEELENLISIEEETLLNRGYRGI